MARDYAKEYREYQGTSEQKKNRAERNAARRELTREGKVHKGDGRDIDHIKPIKSGGTNAKGNLRVTSKNFNRGRK